MRARFADDEMALRRLEIHDLDVAVLDRLGAGRAFAVRFFPGPRLGFAIHVHDGHRLHSTLSCGRVPGWLSNSVCCHSMFAAQVLRTSW